MNQPGALKINNFRKKYKSYTSIVKGNTRTNNNDNEKEQTPRHIKT